MWVFFRALPKMVPLAPPPQGSIPIKIFPPYGVCVQRRTTTAYTIYTVYIRKLQHMNLLYPVATCMNCEVFVMMKSLHYFASLLTPLTLLLAQTFKLTCQYSVVRYGVHLGVRLTFLSLCHLTFPNEASVLAAGDYYF